MKDNRNPRNRGIKRWIDGWSSFIEVQALNKLLINASSSPHHHSHQPENWNCKYWISRRSARFVWIDINPYLIKQMPGHISDVKDAQWIATLLHEGLVRSSLIPWRSVSLGYRVANTSSFSNSRIPYCRRWKNKPCWLLHGGCDHIKRLLFSDRISGADPRSALCPMIAYFHRGSSFQSSGNPISFSCTKGHVPIRPITWSLKSLFGWMIFRR